MTRCCCPTCTAGGGTPVAIGDAAPSSTAATARLVLRSKVARCGAGVAGAAAFAACTCCCCAATSTARGVDGGLTSHIFWGGGGSAAFLGRFRFLDWKVTSACGCCCCVTTIGAGALACHGFRQHVCSPALDNQLQSKKENTSDWFEFGGVPGDDRATGAAPPPPRLDWFGGVPGDRATAGTVTAELPAPSAGWSELEFGGVPGDDSATGTAAASLSLRLRSEFIGMHQL